MKSVVLKVLEELSFPEYRARHVFIAKLRLAIFIGFWFLYVIFLNDYLAETKAVTVAILACFLVTTVCYYNIFNNRLLVFSFILEMLSDLVAITAIIYLTGGPESEYYIIFIFYAVSAGLFYNYRLAFLIAIMSFICYGAFLLLCYHQVIPPLLIGIGGFSSIEVDSPYLYPFLLAIFMALTVYATRIAHIFTQMRERVLEARNKELLALQQMSSTIRTVTALDNVLTQVVNGVLEGLNLTMCLLMLYDKKEKRIRCIPPDMHPGVKRIEEHVGINLKELYFPLEALEENEALKQLKQGRIIFRKDITEVISGLQPDVSFEKFREIQVELDVQRVIAIPLVTGREVIGALIGLTSEAFVEAKKVHTLQAFADQASLAVEAAVLISELRKKNIELVEANRVKSEFLATMSHELRTPLTAIIGFSELLMEKVMGPVTDEQQDSLKEVLGNANNLLEMINNLLDLAKVDSGKMELARHTFDWGEMISRVDRSLAPLVQKKKHLLAIETDSEVPPVFADEKRMQQVILNLLSNAIKFTPDKGEIQIITRWYSDLDRLSNDYAFDPELVSDKKTYAKGSLVCSVRDNGIGISKENLPTIFDVFQQVDSSVTRSYEGTGLGLALVKQFIELHKGFLWVESQEDVGTTFTFVFPTQ